MANNLYELLQDCTVKLTLANGGCGTGFFVAPGYVLTCEHVVRGAGDAPIQMRWQHSHNFAKAQIERILPDYDLALLRFDSPRHDLPCVQLDPAVERTDALYLFGYPERDYPDGRPADFVREGLFTENQLPLVLLKQGQMQPGMSGSALLNCRTGKVCAMAKLSRDGGYADLGGGGIAATVILEQWPDLVEKQKAFHRQDSRWQTFVDRLDTLPPPPKRCPHNLPRSGTKTFVGRQKDLDRVHAQLHETSRLAITALKGMGGIGKTELALQYAYTHLDAETYPGGICWLQARDQDVASQIVRFAKTAGMSPPDGELADQVAYVWAQWPLAPSAMLIIYDDVADLANIQPYLPPQTKQFRVLLTTRQHFSGINNLEIEVLSPEAALDLLRSIVGTDRINAQLAEATALCTRLGRLPLALELVGRYLELDEDLTLAEVQAELDDMRTEAYALLKDETAATMTAKLGVAEAFELSLQRLDETSQTLLSLLSLFAATPIAWEWVQACLADVPTPTLRQQRNKLLQNSLLQRVDQDVYQLHPLIQEFLRVRFAALDSTAPLQQSYCKTIALAANQISQTQTQDDILRLTPLIPHIEEAATTWQRFLTDEDVIRPANGVGMFYISQGAFREAQPWWEMALQSGRDRLGEAHPDVATSLNNLAYLYDSQGRYGEAEPLYQQALALRKQLLGEEHPDVAASLNNLAYLYESQGRYSEAEPLYQQALALRKQLLGEEHPDVASSLNNLAGLYRSQGRYGEAEPLYQQALALWKQLLGEEHPDVAASLNNLAALYDSQGRYGEAEPLYRDALTLYQRLLGEEHPDVASSLNNLAYLYESQGRYSEAEPLYQEALALRKQLLGEAHPAVATSLNNLAGLYRSQGRYSEAEPLAIQALQISVNALGENHPTVGINLGNLASLRVAQGNFEDVEAMFLQALSIFVNTVGSEHPYTNEVINRLRNFVAAVVAANQTHLLSNHPLTQDLLAQLQP